MSRWPLPAVRSAVLSLAVVCTAGAAPLAAQQTSAQEPAVTASSAQTSAPAALAAPAGPRLESMSRVEAKLNAPRASWAQDDVDLRHSYLIYILVAAVLVVLLVYLIKRA